jgi:serine/threonine-protein kinase
VQLDPNFAVAWARLSRADAQYYFGRWDASSAGRGDAAKRALENAQRLDPDSPETFLAFGYCQYRVLRDYEAAKTTFGRVSKMLRNSSEGARGLGEVLRREGHWDESIAYFEQALVLDPRNADLLEIGADTYGFLRQFPAALKLYDRRLDIMPDDPVAVMSKAWIYQAEGNLHEAGKLLNNVSAQTDSPEILAVKIAQLRLERNFREATRLLQSPLAQFHSGAWYYPPLSVSLAFTQRLAGDLAGSKVTAEQMRNTLKEPFKDQPDNEYLAAALSQAYAMLGEKDSAIKAAEQAIMLLPSAEDRQWGPGLEENLALIEAAVGENSRAIKTLTQLLHMPYNSYIYGEHPITPALLRLDPIWDPLRSDPRFQELCQDTVDKSIAAQKAATR